MKPKAQKQIIINLPASTDPKIIGMVQKKLATHLEAMLETRVEGIFKQKIDKVLAPQIEKLLMSRIKRTMIDTLTGKGPFEVEVFYPEIYVQIVAKKRPRRAKR